MPVHDASWLKVEIYFRRPAQAARPRVTRTIALMGRMDTGTP